MRKATLAALDASIEHWRQNKNVKSLSDASVGGENCALCERFCAAGNAFGCKRYSSNLERVIEKCPVGGEYCGGTPYSLAHESFVASDLPSFKKHAARMWRHLKSLRPDEADAKQSAAE